MEIIFFRILEGSDSDSDSVCASWLAAPAALVVTVCTGNGDDALVGR